MTTQEFNNYLKNNEFVSFEFSFMPIGEVPAGRFVCAYGTFYKVLGCGESLTRAENLLGEVKLIGNKTKVSAITNF
jgi:hypothetical protein